MFPNFELQKPYTLFLASESGALDYDITPNCNTQGVTQNYTDGYYACSGQKISPAIASQYCKDNSSYNDFAIKIVK